MKTSRPAELAGDVFMNEEKYTAKDLKFKANERLKVIGMIGLTR